MSSVVAGVERAWAQSGSADISMGEGFGAVPSNFTVPFKEVEASAGLARPVVRRPDSDNATTTHAGMTAYFNFMQACLSITVLRIGFSLLSASWKRARCGCSGPRPISDLGSWRLRTKASGFHQGR